MRNLLLTALLLSLFIKPIFSDEIWYNQYFNPLDRYYCVDFSDSLNGWIGAQNGTIYHTIDGGRNWNKQSIKNNYKIYSIHFFDAKNGLVIANFTGQITINYLGFTNDSGNTWNEISDIHQYATILEDMSFLDNNYGLICGNTTDSIIGSDISVYLKTTNGGKNWFVKYFPKSIDSSYFYPFNINLTDKNNYFITGSPKKFVSTQDGGINWNYLIIDSNMSNITSCSFIDNYTGWISLANKNNSFIKHTIDGGLNFEKQYDFLNYFLRYIKFIDKRNGWIVGQNSNTLEGVIFRTTDGGNKWKLF